MVSQKIIGSVVLFVLTLAIIILVAMTVRKMYNPTYAGTEILNVPVEMTEDMTTCSGSLPVAGNEHTYSFWTYVTHWNSSGENGPKKFIFRREHLNNTLNVVLDSQRNDLHIYLTNSTGGVVFKNDGITDNNGVHRLSNFPLQAWTHVTICVWNKTLDLYLNGKLTRTFILAKPLQPIDGGKFTLGSNSNVAGEEEDTFNGFLSRFLYFPRVLAPREIYKIYMKGPAKSSDLSSKPSVSKLNLSVNLGGPSCATAN